MTNAFFKWKYVLYKKITTLRARDMQTLIQGTETLHGYFLDDVLSYLT